MRLLQRVGLVPQDLGQLRPGNVALRSSAALLVPPVTGVTAALPDTRVYAAKRAPGGGVVHMWEVVVTTEFSGLNPGSTVAAEIDEHIATAAVARARLARIPLARSVPSRSDPAARWMRRLANSYLEILRASHSG